MLNWRQDIDMNKCTPPSKYEAYGLVSIKGNQPEDVPQCSTVVTFQISRSTILKPGSLASLLILLKASVLLISEVHCDLEHQEIKQSTQRSCYEQIRSSVPPARRGSLSYRSGRFVQIYVTTSVRNHSPLSPR